MLQVEAPSGRSTSSGVLLLALAGSASAFAPSSGSFLAPNRLGHASIASTARSAGRVSASSAGASGITMAELNKYSKTITQKKSQGASQV